MPRNRFRKTPNKTQNKPEAPAENAGTKHKERSSTMKLHNLLLASALFLSAGIASALDETPADEETIHSFTFSTNNDTYYWQTSGNNTLSVTLMQYKGDAENEKGWTYYAVGYNKDGIAWEQALTLDNTGITGVEITGDEKNALPQYREGEFDAYRFDVSFNNEDIEKIGIKGRNGSGNQVVYSADNDQATNKTHFSDKDTETVLFFGKNQFSNGQIAAVITAGGSYREEGGTFGQPLPAPVVTLLIALGFGAALTMYRNRKVKA